MRGPPISWASPSLVESWPLRARWISSSLVEKSSLSGLQGKGWLHRPAAFCLLGNCVLGICVMTPGSPGPWVEGRKRPVSQSLILGTWAGSKSQPALATPLLLHGCFDCELPALLALLEAQQGLECRRCSEDVLVPVSPGKKAFSTESFAASILCEATSRSGGRGDGKTQPRSPTPAGPHPH